MASRVGIDPLDKGETALWRAVVAHAIEEVRVDPYSADQDAQECEQARWHPKRENLALPRP